MSKIKDLYGNFVIEPGLSKNITPIKLQKLLKAKSVSNKLTKNNKLCTNKTVKKFAHTYNINHKNVVGCENFQDENNCWKSFKTLNDFFTRKRIELPPDSSDKNYKSYLTDAYKYAFDTNNSVKNLETKVITSPADCFSVCLKRNDILDKLWIKGKHFTIQELFEDENIILENYNLTIFRLAPHHYHRFHCPVYGKVISMCYTGSEYFSVNPVIVNSSIDVYTRNVRLILQIEIANNTLVYMSIIGATCVGSIIITHPEILKSLKTNLLIAKDLGYKNEVVFRTPPIIKPNDELGYFQFGGSSIVLATPTNLIPSTITETIVSNTKDKVETELIVGDILFKI